MSEHDEYNQMVSRLGAAHQPKERLDASDVMARLEALEAKLEMVCRYVGAPSDGTPKTDVTRPLMPADGRTSVAEKVRANQAGGWGK